VVPALLVGLRPGDRVRDAEPLNVISGVELKVATLKVDTGDAVDVKREDILYDVVELVLTDAVDGDPVTVDDQVIPLSVAEDVRVGI
jgi:hypothetical protein